jgi:glycosyltransferase involved in cell wall biosynthesis
MSVEPSQPAKPDCGRFVVAGVLRWDGDSNALALANHGLLRFMALGTRRGVVGVPAELTRLNPKIGLLAYIAARTMSTFRAESFRFRLHPWFDRWVRSQLQAGDHIISTHGFANASFKWVRRHGGKTFLSAGNSHPQNFWDILVEEHRRWNWPGPPISRFQHELALAMLPDVDYVLSPSSFVTNSYLARGFQPAQILRNVYPTDLSCFKPAGSPRDPKRPLTVISTGTLSLRKGTPYLLEAFRLVLQRHPSARLRLTRSVHDSAIPVLARYSSLPIDWAPNLPHPQLAERLRGSDIFVLPSLEDGFARTVTEGLACGLPVILTPNTGACDLVVPDVNGEIVPIRDPQAIADAILKWADRVMSASGPPTLALDPAGLTFEAFQREFIDQLKSLGLLGQN